VREVEVKYRVADPESLLAALKARGIELGPPALQDDQAYAAGGWAYGDDRDGVRSRGCAGHRGRADRTDL
jgi:adenylate cyclase class 2